MEYTYLRTDQEPGTTSGDRSIIQETGRIVLFKIRISIFKVIQRNIAYIKYFPKQDIKKMKIVKN